MIPFARRHARLLAAVAILALGWSIVTGQETDEPDPVPPPAGEDAAGLWDEVLRLYESARESGEQVPRNVYDWVRQDVGAVGAWEYHVETVEGDDPALQARLNELGADRWEVVGFRAVSARAVRLVLKRPHRSYLNKVPLGDLLKLLPVGAGGDSGE